MIKTGSKVQHTPTLAEGEVVRGGFRPRVDWGGRISRIDDRELRVLAEPNPNHPYNVLMGYTFR